MARQIVAGCADCDVCRYLMEDTPCRVFPELYRLFDQEAEKKEALTSIELRRLIDFCNFCALCPCGNDRSDIMKAKQPRPSLPGASSGGNPAGVLSTI